MSKDNKSVVGASSIKLSASSKIQYPKISKDNRGWIKYDSDNQFPQKVLSASNDSPVNSAILEAKVTYICGKGVRDTVAGVDGYVGTPNSDDTWDELIEKVATDYVTFGGFALQIIKNENDTTVSVFHQDFSMVRVGAPNEDDEIDKYYISYDWKRTTGKNAPVELKAWSGIANADKGEAYLLYFTDYRPGLRFYPVPTYYSAINYVRADGALGEFYNTSIDNGFTPSTIICMPSNPGEEDKATFQKSVEQNYGGPGNANNILVIWGENNNILPKIQAFDASKNADLYNNIEGIIFQKIISAHRLSSPTLAGVSGSGNLSGNASEIVNAFILYNYSVIDQLRRKIIDTLNKFTNINGLSDLKIEELVVVDKIRESESSTEITKEA